MVKAGMKELDIDTMSASLEQTLHSASDMIGLGFIYNVAYNIIPYWSYVNTKIQFETLTVDKFHRVLDGILVKLSRYDEGTFSSSILSFTKPNMETANEFVKVSQKN